MLLGGCSPLDIPLGSAVGVLVPLGCFSNLRADANAPTPISGSTTLIVRGIVDSVWLDDFAAIEVSALWAILSN